MATLITAFSVGHTIYQGLQNQQFTLITVGHTICAPTLNVRGIISVAHILGSIMNFAKTTLLH